MHSLSIFEFNSCQLNMFSGFCAIPRLYHGVILNYSVYCTSKSLKREPEMQFFTLRALHENGLMRRENIKSLLNLKYISISFCCLVLRGDRHPGRGAVWTKEVSTLWPRVGVFKPLTKLDDCKGLWVSSFLEFYYNYYFIIFFNCCVFSSLPYAVCVYF